MHYNGLSHITVVKAVFRRPSKNVNSRETAVGYGNQRLRYAARRKTGERDPWIWQWAVVNSQIRL